MRTTQLDLVEAYLRKHRNCERTTAQIHDATGSLAVHTKISQLRDRGWRIPLTRDEWKRGRRICGYTLKG